MFSVLLCPRSSSTKSGSARDASNEGGKKIIKTTTVELFKKTVLLFQFVPLFSSYNHSQIKRKAANLGTAGGADSVQ